MSLASPTVLKIKKTPSRKITMGFRGKFLQKDLAELMDTRSFDGRYYNKRKVPRDSILDFPAQAQEQLSRSIQAILQ
jgi:hypothetical protein